MPNLLFLTQRIPYPPVKGEKIRPLHMLRHLGRSFDIHLGCLIDDPDDWRHVDTVRALCRDAYFAKLDRRQARILCLRGLLNGRPLSVEFFRHAGLARWIDGVLEKVRPDVIFICSSNMAPYVLEHPRGGEIRLCDLADVDSEKWRAYAEVASGPMRWVYRREAMLTAALERRIAHETDASTFVSEPEAALFREMVPDCAAKIHGVSSGVNQKYFDPEIAHAAPYDPTLPTFVFTGTMDYKPNIDAVAWFAEEILPLVRADLPTAQFYIVGNNPAPAVQRLAEREGVHVTGRVPDVRPYVAHAVAAVSPMRIARGIQNKVLEAMAMGKPVIVTPGALEGVNAEPGRDLVLCRDTQEIAEAARRLATGGEGREIGAAARRRIVASYSWDENLKAFDRLVRPPANASAAESDYDQGAAYELAQARRTGSRR